MAGRFVPVFDISNALSDLASGSMRTILVVGFLGFLLLALQGLALAHEGGPLEPGEVWAAWNWDPLLLLSLLVPAWLYLKGVRSLWSKAGHGRGVGFRHVAAFLGGMAALFLALVSPLDALALTLFSAHMVQHLLLVMVAAPLLVLGLPPAAQAWAVPARWRVGLGQWWHRQGWLRAVWRWLTHAVAAWLLHAAAVTLWHIPYFYQAALVNDFAHFLEHASFFFSAVLFWVVVFRRPAHGQMDYGVRMLVVFTMMMYQGVIGALITFSRQPWYPFYESSVGPWGITLLEDQQLAGAIMWVPGNFVYLVVFIWLLWEWFQAMERRERQPVHKDLVERNKKGKGPSPGDAPSV
jgi:putative membrane protein